MLIEQPQHLAQQLRQKIFPLVLSMGITSAVLLSGMMVTILIFQASKGTAPDALRWIVALSLGPFTGAAMVMLHEKLALRRRYLELRNDGVRLSNRGLIRWN